VPAPEQLTIETPEQIALEFPLAGVGSRFLALAFDLLVQGVAVAALVIVGLFVRVIVVPQVGIAALGPWAFAILLTIGFVIYSGYFAVFEAVWSGQTPGKRLVGLRVIDVSGRPLTPYAAILRNVLRLVDQLPGFYAFAIVSVLVTSRHQRLGDLAAGTVVVHERVDRLAPSTRSESTVRLGAHRLTSGEIVLIEGFLRRRLELDPWVRRQSASQIARRMADRLQLGAVEDEEQLLEQLAAEYRASASYR
jgi:uncharacterized RDD family membrane protein YckC